MDWQPIETAPKDGTRIDVWLAGERYADVSWREADWLKDDSTGRAKLDSMRPIGWRTKEGVVLAGRYITHWMPLPPTPLNGKG